MAAPRRVDVLVPFAASWDSVGEAAEGESTRVVRTQPESRRSIAMDSNHQSNYKLSKTEKKFLRKQIKARHTLLRHEGIETVSYATQSLIVANGGLGNQVSRNQLLPVLEKCGLVDALLMPPNKPYSFVRYKTVEESKKAYDTLNGKEIVDDLGQKIFLYLNFVEKAQWKELGLQALPPGLMVIEETISSEDEKMLLESVNWTEDTDNQNFQKSLKHRRVKHFGYEFHYENNHVDKDKPLPGGLPDICDSILEKWLKEGFIKHKPDQLTVNQYEPGHGYPLVCDSQMKETPTSFPESDKEASQLEQEYVHQVYEEIARHFSSTRHTPWPHIVEFLKALPSGSLVADIGCGNGKYLGINKELYMIGCDHSQNLVDICREKHYQAFVCDALAVPIRSGSCDACISIAVIHHFATAERRVAALQELVRLLRPGGKALIYVWAMEQEYNKKKSKYLRENRISQGKKEEISSDTSVQELLVKQMPDVGNQDSAPSVPSINDFQDRGCNSRKVTNSKLPIHTNRTSFHSQDVLVPWHLKENPGKGKPIEPFGPLGSHDPGPVFHRYYHVFCEGEMEAACQTLSNISILQSYYDQGNWCVILQKV
ncbi:alkylated DNA repair protein alkB homolog 8 isoform X3 [Eubalaena glacialis]|uniref:alkylated DNA repair protein alkB homolog 8 isoform X3 n=1 Tax=Eubalaena glacialis TaxID=27606 RepID=UPI002A5A0424|nr:alkylated DNA repair protein alkB homolog 8 isoform X3 [Eubalaena glacialis]